MCQKQKGVYFMPLSNIKDTVQDVAQAISAVLEVDVTIIDENFRRVAATGYYKQFVGSRIPYNCVFEAAAKEKTPQYVDRMQSDSFCLKCAARTECTELATIGYPIIEQDNVIGIIGINAFKQKQEKKILKNKKSLMDFLDKLSSLVVGTLQYYETIQKLKIQAEETNKMINGFKYGILCVDDDGKIKYINKNAKSIFCIEDKDIVSKNLNEAIPEINDDILNKKQLEFKMNINGEKSSIFMKNDPILFEGKKVSNIIEIHKTSDIVREAYNILERKRSINFDDIIGESKSITDVKKIAKQVANTKCTILLYGESGTGKELFARAIHSESSRSAAPFIAINCASIPDNLLESELFGYEGGAFTGARKEGQMGKFELANGGTIFLDEIGDMPLHLQPKILRVLQEHCFTKIGGKDPITVDIRIIAATNKKLEHMVKNGEFREDLYYRLNVIPIVIPPLRERNDDIMLLSNYLLEKYCCKLNINMKKFSPSINDIFINYSWPGNVRELENVIEYLVVITKGDVIETENLPEKIKQNKCNGNTLKEKIETYEYEILKSMLEKHGQTTEAKEKIAQLLDINLSTFYRKLNKYNL